MGTAASAVQPGAARRGVQGSRVAASAPGKRLRSDAGFSPEGVREKQYRAEMQKRVLPPVPKGGKVKARPGSAGRPQAKAIEPASADGTASYTPFRRQTREKAKPRASPHSRRNSTAATRRSRSPLPPEPAPPPPLLDPPAPCAATVPLAHSALTPEWSSNPCG